ncbi:unnamed protein product [Scytosiphon promiscuus]
MAFLRISRIGERGPPIPCYKTEVAKGFPPRPWAPIELSSQILANGDPYRPLLIEAFTWKKSGAHRLLGFCKASINDLKSKGDSGLQNMLLDTEGRSLTLRSCTLTPQPSFFDYIAGGMQIGFTVAIDYTASNGNPSRPGTLHYHDPSGRTSNEYGQAIQSVGGVLEYFDDDRRFPLYGFGGRLGDQSKMSHCFAVNRDEKDPEVEGIEGVLETYRNSLNCIHLSGPTHFAPVIKKAASLAAATVTKDPSRQQYSILLLITDGVICDLDETIEAIVASSDYPFSIVIVGVGKANYDSMRKLDGDDVRLVNRAGKRASRDIVQFVPMRQFKGKSNHALAKEVLYEIPAQVIEYMENNKISPGKLRRPGLDGRQGSVGSMALQESFMHNGAGPTRGNGSQVGKRVRLCRRPRFRRRVYLTPTQKAVVPLWGRSTSCLGYSVGSLARGVPSWHWPLHVGVCCCLSWLPGIARLSSSSRRRCCCCCCSSSSCYCCCRRRRYRHRRYRIHVSRCLALRP